MCEDQRFPAFDARLHTGRIVAGRKILALPIVVLARRPDCRTVARLDLLVVIEFPEDMTFEVASDQFERFLPGRIVSARRHDDSVWKDAGRTAGGVVEAVPSLDDVPIHIDHND